MRDIVNSLRGRASFLGRGANAIWADHGERRVNEWGGRARLVAYLGLAVLGASPAFGARHAITVFRDWGAFSDEGPRRCFAMAAPPRGIAQDPAPASVAVTSWPDGRIRAQLSVLLSHGHRAGAPVTLTIGDTAFPIVADRRHAWARDRRQDAEIVAAMRSGSSMSVSTVSPGGHPYADVYRLRGAASAIDAAMLACPLRR